MFQKLKQQEPKRALLAETAAALASAAGMSLTDAAYALFQLSAEGWVVVPLSEVNKKSA